MKLIHLFTLACLPSFAVWTSSAAPAKDGRQARVKRWMSFMDVEFSGEFQGRGMIHGNR
jgi:hypothetical protein